MELLKPVEGSSSSRQKHLAYIEKITGKNLIDKIHLPVDLQHVMSLYRKIAAFPLTNSEILAWSQLSNHKITELELVFLSYIDECISTYLNSHAHNS